MYLTMTCYHRNVKTENTELTNQTVKEVNQFGNLPSSSAGKEAGSDVTESNSNLKIESNRVETPKFMKGLYISNPVVRNSTRLSTYLSDSRKYGVNTFVMDIQPKMPSRDNIEMVKKAGIFPVARLVVFHTGLKTKFPREGYAEKISDLVEDCAYQGFTEVQLDYIRYADEPELMKIPLKEKYQILENLISQIRDAAAKSNIRLSADVFGRVTLNRNDHIGQRLENFATYMDALYPMVYPSHYHNDKKRMGDPYFTVKEGVAESKKRVPDTAIIAYIQGFSMSISISKLSMKDYLKAQMRAVEDANGDGWVIWNPYNRYAESYAAMSELEQEKEVASNPGTTTN